MKTLSEKMPWAWGDASTSQGMPWTVGNHQKLDEARENPLLELSERVRPCQHHGFGPVAFRTVTQYISVILSYPGVGTLLG